MELGRQVTGKHRHYKHSLTRRSSSRHLRSGYVRGSPLDHGLRLQALKATANQVNTAGPGRQLYYGVLGVPPSDPLGRVRSDAAHAADLEVQLGHTRDGLRKDDG